MLVSWILDLAGAGRTLATFAVAFLVLTASATIFAIAAGTGGVGRGRPGRQWASTAGIATSFTIRGTASFAN